MNLKDWTKLTNIKPTTPTTEMGAVSVVIAHENPHRPELWRLSDYNVSSACGVVVWLLPVGLIDKSRHNIKPFSELSVGDKFRWVGGVTTFLKTGAGSACVDGKPNVICHPSHWEEVVPTGEWTNIVPN